MVDDGTLPGRRGSLNIDDEGNPTQRTVLIEDGVLRGYMQDSLNARLMEHAGHRQRPARIVRARDDAAHDQHLHAGRRRRTRRRSSRSVKKGLYAVNFGGGQVDITSGKFVFSASEAYMIENGKVTYPVKGATLIGNGPDALTRVTHDRQRPARSTPASAPAARKARACRWASGQPTLKIDGPDGAAALRERLPSNEHRVPRRRRRPSPRRFPTARSLALPPDYSLVGDGGGACAHPAQREEPAAARRAACSACRADLLIGAGCVAEVETSAVSLGEAGLAPRFTEARRNNSGL